MYAGEVVEQAPVEALFAAPEHPYSVGLMGSLPRLDQKADRLAVIEGAVPDMSAPPAGCRFAPRCPFADDTCRAAPTADRAVRRGAFSTSRGQMKILPIGLPTARMPVGIVTIKNRTLGRAARAFVEHVRAVGKLLRRA